MFTVIAQNNDKEIKKAKSEVSKDFSQCPSIAMKSGCSGSQMANCSATKSTTVNCDASKCNGGKCDPATCKVGKCDPTTCQSGKCDSSECKGSKCDPSTCKTNCEGSSLSMVTSPMNCSR
jgi:hypothetical protein